MHSNPPAARVTQPRTPVRPPRPVTLVLGCNEVASAIAHGLHSSGLSVVLVDRVDPSCALRGMSYTNAWYIGSAEVEGVPACFCASVRSIPSVLERGFIAATTWSWPAVLDALGSSRVIDARVTVAGDDGQARPAANSHAMTTRGVEILHVDELATTGERPTFARTIAPRDGRFSTARRIGERVRPREPIGALDNEIVLAPAGGVLRGVCARGARIAAGETLVEVDAYGTPASAFGLDPRALRIAGNVLTMLEVPDGTMHAASGITESA
jgi:hypothetical protein